MMKVGVVLSRRTCRAINGGRQVVHKPGGGPARAVPPRSPAHPRELGDNPDTYRHIQTGRSRAGGRGRGHLPLFRLGLVCFLRPHLPDTSAMFPSAGPSGRRLRMRPGHIRSGTYGRPSGSNSGPCWHGRPPPRSHHGSFCLICHLMSCCYSIGLRQTLYYLFFVFSL